MCVAVVIPVLDDADMLRACLAALARQTRPPDRIVVVDNGSVDESAAVARAAGAVVVHEPRRGILPATVRGFDALDDPRGSPLPGVDVLARIDADSRPDPDWLARVATAFADDPELVGLTGPGRFYGGRRIARVLGERLYLGGYFWSMGLLLGHPPLFGSNSAVRAAAWPLLRPGLHLDITGVHDDLDISFRIRPGMRIRFDPTLAMPISARPFASVRGLARRVGWGFGTIWVNVRGGRVLRRRAAIVAARNRTCADRGPRSTSP
ncbi:glycosyltransferase family 2 protein [Nakamurella leprariae]|uniref:4,4'-diaponeurosporenoate glycosyltransferase n=1 Tax=Nakamurella leprariae TaxID=2803911 RepID=A0A939C2A2_9ACTN|nr:glycosyltransferase family 2 protein [Nakamurella leprariae]MBM9467907.1 glycosyltransferase family 2 protein [Nakamurella leprariae]